ncbi:hypothetical protein V8E36_004175 [Tilletia maclaganii]
MSSDRSPIYCSLSRSQRDSLHPTHLCKPRAPLPPDLAYFSHILHVPQHPAEPGTGMQLQTLLILALVSIAVGSPLNNPTSQAGPAHDLQERARCPGCIKQVPGGLEPCCPSKREMVADLLMRSSDGEAARRTLFGTCHCSRRVGDEVLASSASSE